MTRTEAVVLAAMIPSLLLLVGLALWWRQRRRIRRQIHDAAARLDATSLPELRGIDRTFGQLEAAVDRSVTAGGEASAAETRMAHALAVIGDGIVLFDENGDVAFANDSARTYLAARHGEAIVDETITTLSRAALAGEAGDETLELFGPPRRALVLSAKPLDDGFRSIGALVVVRDITERRQLDAVRRDFVANISHELKTPVGGLSVLAETILDEDDLGVIKRLADRINIEAIRATRTIDDLLELSRIEASEVAMRQPIPVHLVMAEAVERAMSAAEQAGIELELVEPPSRLEITGDRRQFVSAIYNLVDNAVKYSDEGSVVKVRAVTDGQSVDIVVSDQGVGIPRRDIERIFERFYRVDRARSRATGGTGLGLAIVRHVATNHGGDVMVESREGIGTTFTLRFPAGRRPVASSDAV